MLKRIAALLLIVVALSLQGCITAGSGLKAYADTYKGYQFLYPTGWLEVATSGADVVFHDLVNDTENVSVVISAVPEGQTLQDLGDPNEVGYKLSKSINTLTGNDRDVQLISAQEIQSSDETYYILEYLADLPSGLRHNLASVIVRRNQLFTFNASTREERWEKMKMLLKQSVASFSVY
ncbi:MAG: photosystem II oxygen evolving complex protein PsbP [Leptolyngbyaceae cyanobacterium SM1_1_3]|nr:photosystem II oxygen evolving complex protein PsbP [Leptolyngbyaceae cyanobacterium SM1_1_3]NJM85265.1 photosystem II oxygen evolving complex protein PsbP [Leptolyngbyaceae cyanobacterium RM2_2_21]NJN01398.1 photosystem II oxygen evolving complex protein PsbP [Leptolyngbyaceae cyanobacterium RM1_1_2]NJO11157.1 photosystem II oxygen evolving complex protein PsbP [Leptolyngbyaceae cyanobacterium SL_1_1]